MAGSSSRLGPRSFLIWAALLAFSLVVPSPSDASGATLQIQGHNTITLSNDASFNTLLGVAATSLSNAWSVGYHFNLDSNVTRTLIEQWDGTAWRRRKSPNVGTDFNILYAVAATPFRAWAVGDYLRDSDSTTRTLIERWNGSSWRRQKSPSVGSNDNHLLGVAATSSTNAWAVGSYFNGVATRTLVEHWDGTAWRRQNSP
jgi:hypothetical protein